MTNEPLLYPRQAGLRTTVWLAVFSAFLFSLLLPASVQAAPTMRTVLVYDGPHIDYYEILGGIARGLNALGLISNVPRVDATEDGNPEALWRRLNAEAGGRLTFLSDGFYSAEWRPDRSAAVVEALRTRLAKRRDVDLILAFGTWAGQEMASLNTTVPVIVCGATDAIKAGIVASVMDSGKDNVVAVLEPGRFLRQMELFHRIFAFRKLGITYTDTPSGRSCAAIDQIETACAKNGVELVRCTGDFFHNFDSDRIAEQMRACHKKFADQRVDAVFITYNSLQTNRLPHVLEPLMQAGIPAISQTGPREVQMGALASITSYCEIEGRFVARLIHGLLEGARPRSLPQLLISPMLLSVNVHTAARIGWNPSLEVLLNVDEFFQ